MQKYTKNPYVLDNWKEVTVLTHENNFNVLYTCLQKEIILSGNFSPLIISRDNSSKFVL